MILTHCFASGNAFRLDAGENPTIVCQACCYEGPFLEGQEEIEHDGLVAYSLGTDEVEFGKEDPKGMKNRVILPATDQGFSFAIRQGFLWRFSQYAESCVIIHGGDPRPYYLEEEWDNCCESSPNPKAVDLFMYDAGGPTFGWSAEKINEAWLFGDD